MNTEKTVKDIYYYILLVVNAFKQLKINNKLIISISMKKYTSPHKT